MNCVHGRTFTGNSIPVFCEAKKVPFLAQVFFFQTLGKFNQNASQKESVMTKIAVIIPVKHEEAKIERCLEAVFNQAIKPFEVIVVDGHSTE